MESVQNKFQERAYCKSEGIFRRPEPCTPRECLLPGVVVVLAVALRTFSTPNESPLRRRSHRSAAKEPAVQLLFCASQKGGKGGRRGIPKGGRRRSHMHTLARLCLLPSLSSLAHQSRGGGEGGGRKRAEEWKEGRKVGAAPPSLRLGRRRRRPPLVSCR